MLTLSNKDLKGGMSKKEIPLLNAEFFEWAEEMEKCLFENEDWIII